jgi:MHS family proline/betaine transporter-like MFS transporter
MTLLSTNGSQVNVLRTTGELKAIRWAIVSCSLGQMFEVFDFLMFGLFAAQIGRAFFPNADPIISLLSSLATFGAGFLMRPLGALVMGYFGDRYGRKHALAASIALMAAATGLTGLVPSYAAVGVTGSILLVACRLLQGFSMGGEWGGAATFLSEHSPAARRGLVGSFQAVGGGIAALGASLTAAVLHSSLDESSLNAWGWRVPFIVGSFLGPFALYLRTRVPETPAFTRVMAAHEATRVPLKDLFAQYGGAVATAIGISAISVTLQYMYVVFLPTYATQTLKIDQQAAFYTSAIGSVINIALLPVMGALSDRIGRRVMIVGCAFLSLTTTYPLFLLLVHFPSSTGLLAVQVASNIIQPIFTGAIGAILAELFITKVRYTALSLSYAISVITFGGFSPFIATFLVRTTGDLLSPAYLVMGVALISGVAAMFVKERGRTVLT